jgi:MoaD family protein
MKQLTVQYFALFREVTGVSEESLSTVAGNIDALFTELRQSHPGLQRFEQMKVGVNDEMADWQTELNDGDVVLLFPPVAGG